MSGYGYKAPGQVVGNNTKFATVSGTSTAVDTLKASQMWILSAGDIFVRWSSSATTGASDATNSALLGAGLYGPFNVANQGRYCHIAGNGGTPSVTVTLA